MDRSGWLRVFHSTGGSEKGVCTAATALLQHQEAMMHNCLVALSASHIQTIIGNNRPCNITLVARPHPPCNRIDAATPPSARTAPAPAASPVSSAATTRLFPLGDPPGEKQPPRCLARQGAPGPFCFSRASAAPRFQRQPAPKRGPRQGPRGRLLQGAGR